MMRRRNVLWPLLALALSGCDLLAGKCTFEQRDLEANGAITESGAELVAAQIILGEQRGSLQGTSMYWRLTGTTLKGHVLSAALKDASDLSKVRLDLPLTSTGIDISVGGAHTQAGANLGGFRDFLAAGRGVIELQTDMPSSPTISFPVPPTRVGDWIRPNCS
jgi:hypothetical protein